MKQTTCTYIGEQLNELFYICTMEYWVAVEKNEEELYELIRNAFQEISISEK